MKILQYHLIYTLTIAGWWSSLASQEIGYIHPKPVGTYFKDIAFVPGTDRVMAIADKSCIIFQSEDAGVTWTQRCVVPSPRAEDGFDQIFFANDQIGFLANNSGHIYRTVDGGETWSVAFDSISCNMFDFEMNSNGIGVATVNVGKIFFTDDFGETWRSKRLSDSQVYTCVGLKDNDEIILSGSNSGGWYSVDTARTGLEVTFGGMNEIEFWDTLRGIAMSESSILFTEDGGFTWFISQFIDPFIESMQLGEDGLALVSDGRKMYRSTDFGQSFTEVLEYTAILDTGDFNLFVDVQGIAVEGDIALTAGDHGTLLRSSDSGASWELLSTHLTTNEIYDVHVNGQQLVAVGQTEILRSDDGGQSLARSRGPDFRLTFVDEFSDGTIIVLSEDGEVFTSQDFGETWIEMPRLEAEVRERIRDAQILPDQSVVAVGDDGLFARSSDQGVTWQIFSGPFSDVGADLRTVDFLNAKSGIAGSTQDRLYRTDDGGMSWQEISIIQNGRTRTMVDVEMIDSMTILAYRTHGAYLSTDGGRTYEEQNTDFHENVEFDDGGKGIWNGFTNVYVTEDYGANWILLSREAESVFERARIFGNDIWLVGLGGLVWRAKDAFLRVSSSDLHSAMRGFRVYPNPVAEDFTIELTDDWQGPLLIQVMSAQGELVREFETTSADGHISVSSWDLPSGQYFVSMTAGRHHLGTQSLVVQH